jgi:hypothetical protein
MTMPAPADVGVSGTRVARSRFTSAQSSTTDGEPAPRSVPPRVSLASVMIGNSLTSPDVCAELHWAILFPQSSSLHSDPPGAEVILAGHARESSLLPTTAEQLGRVQALFGLSKSLLAKACRVQRQTIYDWYAGNFEAEGENAERLQQLWRLTERLSAKGLQSVPSAMVQRKRHDGSTLAALLSAEQLDEPAVERLCDQLAAATIERREHGAAALRDRLGWKDADDESRAETLTSNLDSFVDG